MHQRQRSNQSISHYCSTSSALFPSQHFLHGHSPNNLRTWFAKKRGYSEVKSRKFVIEQTPHSLPSNLFGGHVGKIEQNHKKSSKFSPPGQNPQDKRYQRYFLINIHLTAVSEGVNCIWLLWGWTSLRESCQLSDLHKSDSLARGITLILLGSSTKHSSFFLQFNIWLFDCLHVEGNWFAANVLLMESANIAKIEWKTKAARYFAKSNCLFKWDCKVPLMSLMLVDA